MKRWSPVLGLLLLLGCPAAEQTPAPTAGGPPGGRVKIDDAVVVETARATARPLRVVAHHTGEVRAERVADVAAEVSGRVLELASDLGDRVEAGQVVARLDTLTFERRVEELEAAVAVGRAQRDQAKAGARTLERELERKRPLLAGGGVTALDVDRLEGELAAAEASVSVAAAGINETRARLETARRDLERATVRAPLAGRVAARLVEPGAHIGPGQRLFRILDGCAVVLRVGLPEDTAARVREGTAVSVRLGARTAEGLVKRRAPELDPTSRTLAVDVALPALACVEGRATLPADGAEAALEITPGMTARCAVVLGERAAALTVPRAAIRTGVDGAPSVWVVVDGVAAERRIAVGLESDRLVEVVDGLAAGDRVVLRGQEKLAEGVKVRGMESAE